MENKWNGAAEEMLLDELKRLCNARPNKILDKTSCSHVAVAFLRSLYTIATIDGLYAACRIKFQETTCDKNIAGISIKHAFPILETFSTKRLSV